MPYYPQNATGLNYVTYPAGPTATGTSLTSSASTNTKGSYAQFTASLGFTANAIEVNVIAGQANPRAFLLDIATGAAASEVVVVPNLMVDNTLNTAGSHTAASAFFIPLAIASGTRVAARVQCSTGSQSIEVSLTFAAAGGVAGVSSVSNYGANTGTSGGVQIDPGGTIDTKGSYAQITSSTSGVAQWVALNLGTRGNAAPSSARWCVDLATGAAASEVVLIPDARFVIGTNPGTMVPRSKAFLTYIASATRIAARASCSINDATDRLVDLVVLAATAPSETSGSGAGAWVFGA